MKKKISKFTKMLLLITMIFSDLMTPISVLADEILNVEPNKGDVGINNSVSNDGGNSTTVYAGSYEAEGDVLVTKTVSKTDTVGRYKVEFNVKGKEKKEENPRPIYVVVVFDKSGSMNCVQYSYNNKGQKYCSNVGTKWEDAVSGTKSFANTLNTQLNSGTNKYAYLALVQFSGNKGMGDQAYNDASVVRGFATSDFSSVNFGSASGGTNLGEGLRQAGLLFNSTTIPENALKYVVVVGDGEPTFYSNDNGYTQGNGSSMDTGSYDYAVNQATELKDNGVEIFSIGYSISDDTTAQGVLETIASDDVEDSDIEHFVLADSATIATTFTKIAKGIAYKKAGTNAVLTDNIGAAFTVVSGENITVSEDGSSVTINIGDIKESTETSNGTTVSFYVDIDQDSETNWYEVNNGFSLSYTDTDKKSASIIYGDNLDEDGNAKEESDPEVYWVQKKYNYIVNYYKDSFDNLIASDTREAANGTVINEANVDKNKYLDNSSLGTVGYEFNSINPTSITITNDGTTKVINVLYTIKKFDYVVNYYYMDVNNNYGAIPDSTITESNVDYGTVVRTDSYYLTEVKEGYTLDSDRTNNIIYTITDNGIVIDIYYKRNSYDYTVKYYFNNNIDTDFTKNSNDVYGSVIKAEDNYLEDNKLIGKEEEDDTDYFLDPTNPNNTGEITIGTGSNELNIYYISTIVSSEEIDKISDTTKVTNSDTSITYTVNYKSIINNVKQGQVMTVTIVDTLPYEIDENKSNLNGGIYDSTNKTITWTFEIVASEFTKEFDTSDYIDPIIYTVLYENFASVSSNEENILTNSVLGTTTVGGKTTTGVTDNTNVEVEINGKLIVHHVEKGTAKKLASDEESTDLVGANYTTNYKTDIFGYTVDMESLPANKDGKYVEGVTEVTYVYTKNDGEVENPDVEKTGPSSVDSVNSAFNYTITAKGEVKDYVGKVTLTVEDTLPYAIDENNSEIDNRCIYDGNKTITCTKEYNITEADYTLNEDGEKVFSVNETFNLKLVYVGIDSETVINTAKSTITLDKVNESDNDEVVTDVLKGKVTAIYVEDGNEDNVLADEEVTKGLVGTDYTTNAKDIFGYTLVEEKLPENKDGKYTEDDIIVKYVYTKNDGEVENPDVEKTGPSSVDSVNSAFNYTITAKGEVKDYVGKVTLTVEDTLPYAIDEDNSEIDNRCIYDGNKTITCTKEYNITEADYTLNEDGEKVFSVNETFNLKLVYVGIDSETVINTAKSTITLDKVNESDNDDKDTEVLKGEVIATYKDTLGNTLHEDVKANDLAGKEYTTEEKTFYGYTLVEVPLNKDGVYIANQTIYVDYVYSKNIGTSDETLSKVGLELVDSIKSAFEYEINYNTIIKDYIGKATLVITDELPYEIDVEKSVYGESCEYIEGKLICTYSKNITKEDNSFNIKENFTLYYIDIEEAEVTNKVHSVLTYGTTTKENDSEYTSEVKEGTVIVNYVTKDGTKLTESIILSGLVGEEYNTVKKIFDRYNFVEVIGDPKGEYIEGVTEVTYVYDLTPLPPQTGIEFNPFMFIKYLVFATIIVVSGKTYKLIKNN